MYEVIGIEHVDYTSRSGKHIEGYRVYFTYDLPEGGDGSGKGSDHVFMASASFVQSGISIGDPAMPIYNKYGRCTGFVECV